MKNLYFTLVCALLMGVSTPAMADDFNSSDYFTNLDFESCDVSASDISEACPGWSVPVYASDGPWPSADDGWMSENIGGYVMKLWNDTGNAIEAGTVFLCQTSSKALPAGAYTVTAAVHADGTGGMVLYATDGTQTVTAEVANNSTWALAPVCSLDITLESSAALTIGIMTTEALGTGTAVNMYCDNFAVAVYTEDITNNMSKYYTNLDFESCDVNADVFSAACPGWSVNYCTTGPWPSSDDGWMSDNIDGILMKMWNDTGNAVAEGTALLYQASSKALPAGEYEVSAAVHADGTDGIALYATDGTQTVTTAVTNNSTWTYGPVYTVDITLEEDAVLTVGIMTTEALGTGTAVNMYCDNFTVTQLSVVNEEGGDGDDGDGSEGGENGEGNDDEDNAYFQNLDFESSTWNTQGWVDYCPGWTFGEVYDTNPWPVVSDEWMSENVDGYVVEMWEGGGQTIAANAPVCYQVSKTTVPAGTYKISAAIHADGTDGFILYAGVNGTDTTTGIADSGSGNWSDAEVYSVTVTLKNDSYVEIGIKAGSAIEIDSSSEVNLYCDNFTFEETYEEDGTATGIGSVATAAENAGAVYNLQGMRTGGAKAPGVYVVGGRKVVVK